MPKDTFTMSGRETHEHERGASRCPSCFFPGFPRAHTCGGLEHVESGWGVYRDVSEHFTECDGCGAKGRFLDE